MKPLTHHPVDITVQKLLCLDPHVLDEEIFNAISGLIERCEPAQLERVQASIACRLQQNWPAHRWENVLQQLSCSCVLLTRRNRVVEADLPLSMLLLQANVRLSKCRRLGKSPRPAPDKPLPGTATPIPTPVLASAV